MAKKPHIQETLEELDALYNNSKSKNITEYSSKLALIELCGWIEDSFDDLAKDYAKNNLKEPKNIEYYEQKVDDVYSFDYNHIRPLLIMLVGLREFETIENKLNKNGYQINKLKSTLGRLKSRRDDAAHSHKKNITTTFDAPSKILSDWKIVYEILQNMEKEIKESR